MNILEYAMKMEKDGENYYRQLARQAPNEGLKNILSMLADEEVKHYNALQRITTQVTQMTETTILDNAKNIFVQMQTSSSGFDFNTNQVQLYKKAQDIEQKSRDFYLQKAGQVKQDYQKELFLKLAEEEKKHYFLLDNIIEFVSRPQHWLENAEFYHLEEY